MVSPTPEFLSIVADVIRGSVEVTLAELIEKLGHTDDGLILDHLDNVKSLLDSMKLNLTPPLTTGDLNTVRILRSSERPRFDSDIIKKEIMKGESGICEFKSSLWYDHRRAEAQPSAKLQDLKSEVVLFSCLKTIAAFLNIGGGILFIGVNDEGSCIGLNEDSNLMGCTKFNGDSWELELRNQITGKFKDGVTINDYVDVSLVEVESNMIARVSIQGRRKLSFLKKSGQFALYRRQGNRTAEVPIEEIEEFIEFRKNF